MPMQGVKVSMPRSASTLQLCKGSPQWQCQLCRQVYSSAQPTSQGSCLYCGISLGPQSMQCMQSRPAVPACNQNR